MFLLLVCVAILVFAILACLGVMLMMSAKIASCPSCGAMVLERRGRKTKDFVPWLFGFYPWRCRKCLARFRIRQRVLPTQTVSQDPAPAPREFRSKPKRITKHNYTGR